MRAGFLVVILSALSGCAGHVPLVTDAQLARARLVHPGTSREALDRGRTLYVGRCSGCHTLHTPDEYAAPRWRPFVLEMAPRAKLQPDEAELIIGYLEAVSPPASP